MRPVPTSIVIATLATLSAARFQDRSVDEPSRMPPGPSAATTDADLAGLHRYEPTGLSILRPYRRGRIPVVFVHGLWSGPWSWSPMVEALEADPALRDRYQFWAFGYSTGDPILYSAWLLRRDLDEARRRFDPEATDAAFDRMVVVGHSMGGLLAKMMVQDSRSRLWRLVSDRPFEELAGDPEDRDLFRRALFFRPRPEVRRVVFIATPHRGSRVDRGGLERLGARLVRIQEPLRAAYGRLMDRNGPAFFRERLHRACRPASTSWSGGRPSSRDCRSWGWLRGSWPTPSSRTGTTHPAPGAATASSPSTVPTSTRWRPRTSCRPATFVRATPR